MSDPVLSLSGIRRTYATGEGELEVLKGVDLEVFPGELVGLIFDGNIESLPGNYFYDEAVNRGVSVDARAITHALDKVYGATALVAELTKK